MKHSRKIIALVMFTLYANFFLYRMIGSLAVSLIGLGFLAFLLSVAPVTKYAQKYRLNLFLLTLFPAVLFCLIPFRGSIFVQTFLFLSGFSSSLFVYAMVVNGQPFVQSLSEFITIPIRGFFSYLAVGFVLPIRFVDVIRKRSGNGLVKNFVPYVAAFFAGLPAVLILLGLFSLGDPIFAKTLTSIIPRFSLNEFFWRIVISFFLITVTAPFAVMTAFPNFISPSKLFERHTLSGPLSLILGMIALTVGFFLAVQWPYVFLSVAKETDLSKFGVATYSEYVRRGFFELLIAGIFIYCLSWIGYLSFRGREKGSRQLLPIIQMIVLSEFMLFLISVGRRVLLYWQFHGLSLTRVYGGLFLLFIFAMTVILMLRHIRRIRWVIAETAVCGIFILTTGLWNAESYIVSNQPPTVNNRVDHVYLSRLSPDGYDGWIIAIHQAKAVIDAETATSGTIKKEKIRDIAYAGLVMRSISSMYDRLIRIYGTQSEKNAYLNAILNSEKLFYERYIRWLNVDIATISKDGNSVKGTLDGLLMAYTDSSNRVSTLLNDKKNTLERLADIEKIIAIGSADPERTDGLRSLRPQRYFYGGQEFAAGCRYMEETAHFICIPGFYDISLRIKQSAPSFFERVYLWNFQQASVYLRLKNDLPFAELLRLENDYRDIYMRIMVTPESDRIYEQDISTDALFLAR